MANHANRVYDHILEMLSGPDNPTPLVKLTKVNPFKNLTMYGKLEWYNPFGAVKDRIAANLIFDAESKGYLDKTKKLIEPTSGNTGIGLANVSNVKGYKLTTTLSSAIPQEKRTVLRFLGSEVIEVSDQLCPAPGAPEGAIGIAKSTAQRKPNEFVMLNQYENEANPDAHYRTTGPEIWKQTAGEVTHFIAGLGTCGTITGTGRFLKEKNSSVQIIGVHPQEGHDIPGVRSIKQLRETRFFNPSAYNQTVEVSNKDAYDMCMRLNREEGIIAGPSSGMALAGAIKALHEDPVGIAVIIFPDNIFKYTTFFERVIPGLAPKNSVAPVQSLQVSADLVEQARNPYNTIEVDEAHRFISLEKPMVIDVRPQNLYKEGHVPGAKNIPLTDLHGRLGELSPDRETYIITVCNRGNASLQGLLILKAAGYKNVKSMNKGTIGWMDAGFKVE